MKDDFARRFTGSALIAAGLMAWLGWMLLPVRIGVFFEEDVFARIHGQFHLWIWMFRIHFFGMVILAAALVALATQAAERSRVLVWPGVVVAAAGIFVGALGDAFYYHHGAWGALEMAGKSPAEVTAFVTSLRVDTEYVTCLTRFGRVFGGLGFVLLAWGLARGRLLPLPLAVFPALTGVAAMALTMGLPDSLGLYQPVFHGLCLWMLLAGLAILRGGGELS